MNDYRVVDRRGGRVRGRVHPDEALRRAIALGCLMDGHRRPGAVIERMSSEDRESIQALKSDDPALMPALVWPST